VRFVDKDLIQISPCFLLPLCLFGIHEVLGDIFLRGTGRI
jgi:hypothetical protein